MSPHPVNGAPHFEFPLTEGRSSFQDVTLLSAPLLSEAERGGDASRARSSHASSHGAPKATTVRILKFGFGRKADTAVPWRGWDPLQDCRGQPADVLNWKSVTRFLPCLDWMTSYKLSYLKGDVVAGLSVGFMLIPQGMAYARVAGLPPEYGLYTGWVPSIVYAIFGSSRQMALGPTSLVSLLVAEAVRKLADTESTDEAEIRRCVSLALLLALMVGLVQICGGLIRLGWTVRFLSHAVVSGFSSGAAIIIGLTQMRYVLGVRYPRSDKMHIMVKDIIMNLNYIHYPSLIMSSTALTFLLVMKHYGKTYKKLRVLRTLGPILAVVLGICAIHFSGNPWAIRVAGAIPSGPPEVFLVFPWQDWEAMLMPAVVIAGAAYLESVGMAKALAAKNGYSIDANQELVGLGMANVIGSMFSAYPTGGSFSRTIVNQECGAKTGLAGFVAATLIFFALVCFTPLFELLPLPVLAAIVMSSVVGLVDQEEALFLLRVAKKDFVVWLLAFVGTMFFGIQVGILVSVLLSLGFVIESSANPQCQVLGRLPGTTVYRNTEQYPDAKTTPGIIVLRFHSPLYFANVSNVREALRNYENCSNQAETSGGQPVQYVIVDMTSVSSVDSAACQAILDIHQEYQARGIRLALTNPSHVVMKTLERANIPDMIGRQWFFVRVYDAVRVCKADMARLLGPPHASSPALIPHQALSADTSRAHLDALAVPPSLSVLSHNSEGFQPAPLGRWGSGSQEGSQHGKRRGPTPSPPLSINGGGRSGEVAVTLGPHSAPEVLQSQHVLLDELDSDLCPDSPTFKICSRCRGLKCPPDSPALQLQSRHVLLSDCLCKHEDNLCTSR